MSNEEKDVVLCKCGMEMIRYPEAYLCMKCDSKEIAKLADYYYMKFLKDNGINNK